MAGQPRKNGMLRTAVLVSCAAASLVLSTPGSAFAEEPGISATGKGITGGALLGGEVVMSIEAAFGVQNEWMYLLGGLGGAAAGGVGGYFVEGMDDPKPSYYMLAAGMALVIPTTVAVLQATSYKAPVDYVEDRPGADTEPAPAATQPGAATPAPGASRASAPVAASRPHIPLSLVDVNAGTLRLGIPAVAVIPAYTPTEIKVFGVEQKAEVRVPMFQATF